jgi:hypothetical protein
MKNIKDITISIFAVIGIIVCVKYLVSEPTNRYTTVNDTPRAIIDTKTGIIHYRSGDTFTEVDFINKTVVKHKAK